MSTRSAFLILTFILGASVMLALSAVGCTKEQRSAAGRSIVTCSEVSGPAVLLELAKIAAMAAFGHATGAELAASIEDEAFRAGKEIGGCAYLAIVRARAKPTSAPSILPDTGAVAGAASLARLSARFGGVEWR